MTVEEQSASAQFTLFPMSDDFVDIILGALKKVDTAQVDITTDNVSTEIRGTIRDIFDVTNAIFLNAANTGKHVAISGTASIGCPGNNSGTIEIEEGREPLNRENSLEITQKAGAKFSLYPLGDTDYMKKIEEQIDLSGRHELEVQVAQGATRLDGETNEIFKALENSFDNVQKVSDHLAMAFTVSANSPSDEG